MMIFIFSEISFLFYLYFLWILDLMFQKILWKKVKNTFSVFYASRAKHPKTGESIKTHQMGNASHMVDVLQF